MASQFPSVPALSAIIQQATTKRSGLVADCIFPPVKTPCFFQYIDWTNGLNIKIVEDAVTCKSDVKEVDPEAWTLVSKKVEDHALQQSMGDCCVTVCGDQAYATKKEQGKTIQLMNRLLLARERRAAVLATTEASYTSNGTSGAPVAPSSATINEGGLYFLTAANLASPSFALLQWFMPIQANNYMTGRRTVAVMSRNKLNALLVHPNFKDAGCVVDPLSTESKVAALLGVDKICVADAGYNNSVGPSVSLTGIWPDEYIWFGASYEFVTSEDPQVAFGISAYDKGFRVNHYIKEEKGPDAGVDMQKQAHDLTEVVLTYKAATLVKIV